MRAYIILAIACCVLIGALIWFASSTDYFTPKRKKKFATKKKFAAKKKKFAIKKKVASKGVNNGYCCECVKIPSGGTQVVPVQEPPHVPMIVTCGGGNLLSKDQQRRYYKLAVIAFVNSVDVELFQSHCNVLKTTHDKIMQRINQHDADWNIVWGPAAFKPTFGILQIGMMFVLRSKSDPNKYSLVIRGTNPISINAWLLGDFLVKNMVPWSRVLTDTDANPSSSTQFGKVSESTFLNFTGKNHMGVKLGNAQSGLLYMKPCGQVPGSGKTIVTFLSELSSNASAKVHLMITGKSLGGTLSIAMHQYLIDRTNHWNQSGKVCLQSAAFASPSNGDAAFAQHVASLGNRCQRIFNTNDATSRAWGNIKSLYNAWKWQLPIPIDKWIAHPVECGCYKIKKDKVDFKVKLDQAKAELVAANAKSCDKWDIVCNTQKGIKITEKGLKVAAAEIAYNTAKLAADVLPSNCGTCEDELYHHIIDPLTRGLLNVIGDNLESNNYAHAGHPVSFTQPISKNILWASFAGQALHQHGDAYLDHYNLPGEFIVQMMAT
jgi:hypothetical protein